MTNDKQANTYLSKSLFIRGLQCPKSLYLHKFHPELKDAISDAQEALFQSGFEVGDYAKRLFPGGTEIVYKKNNYDEQVELTRSDIEKGTTTIYEAAFSYDNIFIKADILHKGKAGWELYEVKSSSDVHEHHINDVSLQHYVITNSGLPVSKAYVVHVNNDYIRDGEIEVEKLFAVSDVTEKVLEKQDYVEDEINKMRTTLLKEEIPDIDIGEHCSKPYECNFGGHCWRHIPKEYPVFDLCGNGASTYDLYRQGILYLKDIPLDILPYGQRTQVEMFIKKGSIIDKAKIKEFLDTLWYPIYFLDFETLFMVPIPLFNNTHPYEKMAFQYSLHYIEEGSELKHHEFLPSNGNDPREQLINKLMKEIPDKACVIAWNKTFEEGRLKEFKKWFPEYSEKIDLIISNMRDPMPLFRSKDIYYWQMNGSYSLKNVLPVLVSEMSYTDLEVSNGGMAANAYLEMIQTEDTIKREQIRQSLLKYCKLDTLAMVKILERLKALSTLE